MNQQNQNREITVYLGGNDYKDTQTVAYAKSEGYAVRSVDVRKESFTGTQLLQLADKMEIKLPDLIDQQKPFFKTLSAQNTYNTEGWMELILNNPEIIKTPIIQRGNKVYFIDTPTDALKINK
jgi:arsenate reductase